MTFSRQQQNQIRNTLAESLKGVVAQNLLKRIDKPAASPLWKFWSSLAIANLIREAKTYQIPGMIQVGKKYGMQPSTTRSWTICDKQDFAGRRLRQSIDKNKFRPFLKDPPWMEG